VLATARDEPEYWEKLDFFRHDSLWRRFRCYRLPEPEEEAVVSLLAGASKKASIPVDRDELPAIAATNDGTFANAVVNLELARREGQALSLEEYRPSAGESWRASYQRAVRWFPAAVHVYDALDLLAQSGVAPRPWVIVELGAGLWGGTWPVSLFRRGRVRQALGALVRDHVFSARGGLIRARDGQVEGKGYALQLEDHYSLLVHTVLWAIDRWGKAAVSDSLALVTDLVDAERYVETRGLIQEVVRVAPGDAAVHFWSGVADIYLGRYKQAIKAFERAIELEPKYGTAHNNRGLAYAQLQEYERAMEDFERAIELNPEFAEAYYNRGIAYGFLQEYERAIEDYDRAIELNPEYAEAYYNRGLTYAELQEYERPIEDYDRAIELNPELAEAYYNKACAYALLSRAGAALGFLERAIELAEAYRGSAREDEDFDGLRGDERFDTLIAGDGRQQ
jgi:tetratricopeptide (TPR) repeat protein